MAHEKLTQSRLAHLPYSTVIFLSTYFCLRCAHKLHICAIFEIWFLETLISSLFQYSLPWKNQKVLAGAAFSSKIVSDLTSWIIDKGQYSSSSFFIRVVSVHVIFFNFDVAASICDICLREFWFCYLFSDPLVYFMLYAFVYRSYFKFMITFQLIA